MPGRGAICFVPSFVCTATVFLTVVRATTDPPYGIFMRRLGPRQGDGEREGGGTNWQAVVVCSRTERDIAVSAFSSKQFDAVCSNTYVKCISIFERVVSIFCGLD